MARKYMPVAEFRALGLLQEVNRRFLHPMGLALEVMLDLETKEEVISGIWDFRDDPEGIVFAPGELESPEILEKVRKVNALIDAKRPYRSKIFGGAIQPVPGLSPAADAAAAEVL